MKKGILLGLSLSLCLLFGLQAQEVPRTIIVEHFTNSRCGICASRNPGFYSNLNSQEGILHLAIHPSSPYSSCIFSQANPGENDGRTNYYGIYGGTPRLVIQGTVISSGTNYGNASIFDPYLNQTTPVSLDIRQTKEDDQIIVSVTITAEADNNLGTASLFLAAAEKEVMYNAPNGENVHHDVFRRTFNGEATGMSVDVPATAGESITVSGTLMSNADWVFDQLFTVAILQETNSKAVIQSSAADPSENEPLVNTAEVNTLAAQIFPNPVQDRLQVQLATDAKAIFLLFNSQGQVLQSGTFQGQTQLEMATYPSGLYWLEVQNAEGKAVRKIVK
jgi:hypothetical protein